ncbi:Mth938-like domain-containing protein [Sphingomonas quercus]|uniref:Mth938-like domain-containing protein n=1 Tax=Sphingomonas quercus TaxID=2842451 RepID=A0ABS6BLI0_9SPHN|nr:Mth938-like domain-containing protein [Sphingomonas quercus]MBU3079170.1 Mth938-like domain-containing protein [Sphingomonas quercus]
MPRLELERQASGPQIRGFTAAGGFRVDEGVFPRGLLITSAFARDWSPPPLDALGEADLAALLDPQPEFLLLGTGPAQAQPVPALRKALEARGLGIEAMDSRAAARLWGVLRAEGRVIGAALYPLSQ